MGKRHEANKGKARPTLRLSLFLKWFRQPRILPAPLPALVREYQEVRTPLRLDLPYYAAREREGYTLIPWDRYMEEAEKTLEAL